MGSERAGDCNSGLEFLDISLSLMEGQFEMRPGMNGSIPDRLRRTVAGDDGVFRQPGILSVEQELHDADSSKNAPYWPFCIM